MPLMLLDLSSLFYHLSREGKRNENLKRIDSPGTRFGNIRKTF